MWVGIEVASVCEYHFQWWLPWPLIQHHIIPEATIPIRREELAVTLATHQHDLKAKLVLWRDRSVWCDPPLRWV